MFDTDPLPVSPQPTRRMPNLPLRRQGVGMANGTFGELLQGALQTNDDHFLVTLPIRKFSKTHFTPDVNEATITITPTHKTKSLKLARTLLEYYGSTAGGHLVIESELPEGKGMASSSADLIATVRALEATLGQAIPLELLLTTLRAIEPTDGVMFHEFVTFFHRRVEPGRRLGFPSPLKVVAIDEGGQVDTIEYNRHNSFFTDEECAEYAGLLREIEIAISVNDLAGLGRISTRSAILNQRRNPKRHLDQLIETARETGALGVVVAHSGPCLGLLFPDAPAYVERIARAETLLRELTDQVMIVESLTPEPLLVANVSQAV
jgi:uncharacterized protein involved in propanediol utilization